MPRKKKHEHLESLTIVSADGTPRIKFATDERHGLPLVEFFGKDGMTRRLCIGLNPEDTPFLSMHRKDGTAAASMGVPLDDADPGFTIYHSNGHLAVKMWLRDSGDFDLELFDRNGDFVSRFRIDKSPETEHTA